MGASRWLEVSAACQPTLGSPHCGVVAPVTSVIYAATAWKTNAALIVDVHRLGYLKDTDLILDPTWGRGRWWTDWAPTAPGRLVARDRYTVPGDDEWDFRAMDYVGDTFDAVAFDPPYVSVGGRETTTIQGMHDAYGMGDAPTTPDGVQGDINTGLEECFRVVKKGGIVLCKCQSYVTSGKLYPGTFNTWMWAVHHTGFQLVDHLCHISGARPQPAGRRQVHARRNQSDLLVLRRPRR